MEPLVDQFSSGVLHSEPGLGMFETLLAAAVGGGASRFAGGTLFDSGPGLAVRRWCPPLLGLEPHCSPVRYLARRRELGAFAAGRALLRGSGISTYLLSPGAAPTPEAGPEGLMTAGEFAAAADAPVRETVCLQQLTDQVAATSGTVEAFLRNTGEAVHAAGRQAPAFLSVDGFLDGSPPEVPEVRRAAARLLRTPTRPPEPVLVRHLLWSALTTGRPVQLRCGDPQPLAGFLAASRALGSRIVLLPRAPHHRTAAQLAAAFPQVYTDVGPSPAETLAEAPFGKLLFTSSARGLPELYVAGARLFTESLRAVLTTWVDQGRCRRKDADHITRLISHTTARHLYAFP